MNYDDLLSSDQGNSIPIVKRIINAVCPHIDKEEIKLYLNELEEFDTDLDFYIAVIKIFTRLRTQLKLDDFTMDSDYNDTPLTMAFKIVKKYLPIVVERVNFIVNEST